MQHSGYHLLALVASVSLSACSMGPVHVEEDFGKSVRQMVAAQIADVEVASNPQVDGPLLLDGAVAEEAIVGYRESAKRPEDEEPVITFNLD